MIYGGTQRPALSMVSLMRSFDTLLNESIENFWKFREESVRKAKHMDGFSKMIAKALENYDVEVHKNYKVLGFFRPAKRWDLVVTRGDQILAAIEYKSQVGESTRKNFNNRLEEAVGSAYDFKMAEKNGVISTPGNAWLGYLFVLESTPEVMNGKGGSLSVFENYSNSFNQLEGNLYDKASLLLVNRGNNEVSFGQQSLKLFLSDLCECVHNNV